MTGTADQSDMDVDDGIPLAQLAKAKAVANKPNGAPASGETS